MATFTPDTEIQKLSEQELKSAIKSAWKKHEELAKADMAPLLYWLRERLRAQGSRNDIHDKDRGFGVWVEDHLEISRRTADRWCDWYAIEAGLKQESTSGHVSKSDVELYEEILNQHRGKQQIAFNYWIKTATHAQFQKALSQIQNKFGLKDKKEALVRGVIYAATVIDKGAAGKGSAKMVGHVSLQRHGSKTRHRSETRSNLQVRTRIRAAHGRRKAGSTAQALARAEGAARHKQGVPDTNGHRGEGSSKAMRAASGR